MKNFDAYRKWLGIPPDEQPPHHYRLLGIGLFESDPDVITNAADRQMLHVRGFQGGKFSDLSQKTLNELAAARLCLLNPTKKREYDEWLQQQLAQREPPVAAPSASAPLPAAASPPASETAPPSDPAAAFSQFPIRPSVGGPTEIRTSPPRRKKKSDQTTIAVVLGVAAVGLAFLLWAALGTGTKSPPRKPASTRQTIQQPERNLDELRPSRGDPSPATRSRPRRGQPTGYTVEPDPVVEPFQVLTGHEGPVNAVAVSADAQSLLTAGEDKSIRLWNATSGEQLHRYASAGEPVRAAGFTPDGTNVWALSGALELPPQGAIHVWPSAGGDEIRRFEVGPGSEGLRTPETLEGMVQPIRDTRLSPDGTRFLLADGTATLRLLDPATGDEVVALTGHEAPVVTAVFSPDGATIASAGLDRTVRLWQADTGSERHRLTAVEGIVRSLAFSPDGSLLVGGDSDDKLHLWDVASGMLRQSLTGHRGGVECVAFLPDGKHMVSGSRDGPVRLWEVETGRQCMRFGGEGSGVTSLAVFPDGRQFAAGSADGTVRIWAVPDASALADTTPEIPPLEPMPEYIP